MQYYTTLKAINDKTDLVEKTKYEKTIICFNTNEKVSEGTKNALYFT
jgi:hypothetical protein